MYLYVICHGEPIQNPDAKQGHTHGSLSDRGTIQITTLIPFVESFGIDAAYTSDVDHCIASATLISPGLDEGVTFLRDDRLRGDDDCGFSDTDEQTDAIICLLDDIMDRHEDDDSILLLTHRSTIARIHHFFTGQGQTTPVADGSRSLYSFVSKDGVRGSCILDNCTDHYVDA